MINTDEAEITYFGIHRRFIKGAMRVEQGGETGLFIDNPHYNPDNRIYDGWDETGNPRLYDPSAGPVPGFSAFLPVPSTSDF